MPIGSLSMLLYFLSSIDFLFHMPCLYFIYASSSSLIISDAFPLTWCAVAAAVSVIISSPHLIFKDFY